MKKRTVRALFALITLSIVLLGSYSFGEEQYYVFNLGKHSIHGNEIEFSFPSPPPTETLYLFNYQWEQKELYKKARLVVKLYDKSKKLLSAGESIWRNM